MQTTTTISSGRLEGVRCRGGVVFRGVPFASVTPGDGRFRAPGPAASWTGTRRADQRGRAAPQRAALSRRLHRYSAVPAAGWSEDCLHADVYTPDCARRGLPVMLWIHGGGYSHGSGSFWIYGGDRLCARGDVVVVAVNYRLGAFGNADLRWLHGSDAEANVGLRDQLAALRFVRDEIEAFGGDPGNVTLFGQSAGAMSIGALMAAREARGLFHRAVLQSGAARNVHPPAEARRVAEQLLGELGIDPDRRDALARLRATPAEALLGAQLAVAARIRLPLGMLAWQPCADDALLPRTPEDALRAGAETPVPLLVGTNRDEWKMFTATDARRRQLDERTLRDYLGRTLERDGVAGRVDVDDVLSVYASDADTGARRSPADVWMAFQTDRVFRCPAVELADARAAQGVPTWLYRFDRAPAALRERVGACHSLELPFVFGTLRSPALRAAFAWPPAALRLSDEMQDAWIAFARHGDPTAVEAPSGPGGWTRYRGADDEARVFGGRVGAVPAAAAATRRLWARLSPPPPASTRAAPA